MAKPKAEPAPDPVRDRPPEQRRKMSSERSGITHKFRVGDTKGYLTVNTYDDGVPGEIFLKMDKQGSQVSGFCDAWAIAISIMLQMSVPLNYIVGKYKGARFEPEGMTGNPEIRFAQSPVDYVVRWLELKYLEPK